MKKKIFAAVLAAVMIFALMGCSTSTTVTKTETVTDASGKTTTTQTVTTTQNGTKTETTTVEESVEEPDDDKTVATLAFKNVSGVDIYTMKFTSSLSDDWGEDILGEDAPLENNQIITYENKFTYHPDNLLWDLKIADKDDEVLEFRELDISQAADPEYITIVLTYDEAEQAYSATVE